MTQLLTFVRNALWHAFSSLADDQEGIVVPKSKLKVLVTSLGTILDCHSLSLGVNEFKEGNALTFGQFETYLSKEVFSSLGESWTKSKLHALESEITEACWIICKNNLLRESKLRDHRIGSQDILFKLFRIFCLLADCIIDSENDRAQVLLCCEEMELVFSKFLTTFNKEWDLNEDFECLFSNTLYDFQTFVAVIELKLMQYFDYEQIYEVVNDLHEEYVEDIIKKGMLLKKREYFSKYKDKMFILKSTGVVYFSDPEKQKVLTFDSDTRVEEIDQISHNNLYLFYITISDRELFLATMDKRSRTKWVSAIKLALSRLHSDESHGRYIKNRRRLEWHRIRIRRQQECQRTMDLLKEEKMARLAAEDQARELAVQKAVEEEQRRQLDVVRLQLEKLLEEEIQAKRDEELVRSLQAQILNEEWSKRDELEQLQNEQRKLLDMERNKSKTYRMKQIETQRKLEEAEKKLKELKMVRAHTDEELRVSREKNEERNREILETRLKLFSAPIVEDEKFRRARRSVSMRESRNLPANQSTKFLLPKIHLQSDMSL